MHHDHDHEHPADCDCGCHDHDHDHDGHAHEHDHAAPEGEFLNVATHGQAAVASYRFELSDQSDARELLVSFASEIGREVESRGALIGHIKVMAQQGSHVIKVSVTDEIPEVDEFEASTQTSAPYMAEGVAIVIGISEPKLESIVRAALGK